MIGSRRSKTRVRAVVMSVGLVLVFALPAISQPAGQTGRHATLLKQAREALQAGRAEEAIRLTDEILGGSPAHRDATVVRIEALLTTSDVKVALEAYEGFLKAAKQSSDIGLLALIGRAELRALSTSQAGDLIRVLALEKLASAGDAGARAKLAASATAGTKGSVGSSGGDEALIALARLGDRAAIAQLSVQARTGPTPLRVTAIDALKTALARDAGEVLIAALRDQSPAVQTAAADAIGALNIREAIPALKQTFAGPIFVVRVAAGVALKRLGDPSADAALAEWLKSEYPDVRLMAAQAFANSTGGPDLIAVLGPLLADRNGLTRLKAAELLVAIPGTPARETLVTALSDPNAAVRAEAARIVSAGLSRDYPLLAHLLRDSSPWVRLHAAGAIVAQARPTAG